MEFVACMLFDDLKISEVLHAYWLGHKFNGDAIFGCLIPKEFKQLTDLLFCMVTHVLSASSRCPPLHRRNVNAAHLGGTNDCHLSSSVIGNARALDSLLICEASTEMVS